MFEAFRRNKLSVDVVATSEVSVSLTLDPKKITDMEVELVHLKVCVNCMCVTRVSVYVTCQSVCAAVCPCVTCQTHGNKLERPGTV